MEKASDSTQYAMRFSIDLRSIGTLSCLTAKRPCLGILVRVLLSLVHLLLEFLRFLVIRKAEASHTVLKLETVEEDTILVVLECVVDLLIPYYPPISGLVLR